MLRKASLGKRLSSGADLKAHEGQGAWAFFFYALCVSRLLVRHKLPAFAVTASSILTWMAAAFGLWYAVLR